MVAGQASRRMEITTKVCTMFMNPTNVDTPPQEDVDSAMVGLDSHTEISNVCQ